MGGTFAPARVAGAHFTCYMIHADINRPDLLVCINDPCDATPTTLPFLHPQAKACGPLTTAASTTQVAAQLQPPRRPQARDEEQGPHGG